MFAQSNSNVSIAGRTNYGNASDIQGPYIGLLGRAPTTGYQLVLTDTAPNTLFQVDGHGNVAVSRSYQSLASTVGGGRARMLPVYSPQEFWYPSIVGNDRYGMERFEGASVGWARCRAGALR